MGLYMEAPPCLAFVTLCAAGTALLVWTQVHVLLPRLRHAAAPPTPRPGGSAAGTPCLLSRLYDVECSQLIAGNTSYLTEMAGREWRNSRQCRQEPLHYLAQDCGSLTDLHGYLRWPVTAQEEGFPLAFGLKIHHAPDMFARLLRVLWRPHNFYCIHVDSKTSPQVYELVKNVTDCFHNVMMAQTRIDVVYLSIASLLSDMECMRMAFRSTIPWKYYLNLSGQEFPLKTNLELVQILSLLGGKNDVESYLPTRYVDSWFAFKYAIVNGSLKPTKKKKDPFMYPVQIRKGSAYGTFSRAFLDFALTSQLAREFVRWLADTMAPDELFWATLNHMAGVPGAVMYPVSHRYRTVLSRAVVWQWDHHKCRQYVRGVCIFTSKDLAWLVGRPELIANKFNESTDPVVLDCLEIALESRAVDAFREVTATTSVRGHRPPPRLRHLDWAFYQTLPHLKHS
ncbi:N-acetyllactosaminide beta-1,6-N-acetylglucosaminyl-transferase-like [Babylonia areolata]|uniref:N-acetyllactosaminide beta-1,6-N-acetylglucosaminyl-transferase-like n=1 Tax=Babylonia areolata TaxID=304850 RepID=UPI003FD18EA1